jgi:hypothetical protein
MANSLGEPTVSTAALEENREKKQNWVLSKYLNWAPYAKQGSNGYLKYFYVKYKYKCNSSKHTAFYFLMQ